MVLWPQSIVGHKHQLWVARGFVRIRDPCKIRDLALSGLTIKTLWVPGFANVDGRIDEDFEKPKVVFLLDDSADAIAILSIRANEGCKADQSGRSHQTSHFPNPANIFFSVFGGESQSESFRESNPIGWQKDRWRCAQSMAYVVTVEQKAWSTQFQKHTIQCVGNGGLPRTA
jgi:hypothetical protein